ncbi:MAG: hypothetical protein ACREAO_06440 [Nitrososphaera sp.]|jgi:hypothetical protein
MAEFDRQRIVSDIHGVLKGLLFTETEVFYFHLENLGVSRDEILDSPDKFVRTLRDIFGNGSSLIESAIIAEMSRELKVEAKEDLAGMLRFLGEKSV